MPTDKMPPDVQASYTELAEQGFPQKVSRAFQMAADQVNCVISSRVPGKACTSLIDEGYDLKPFYVHGKSCNWGPMAGFVCQLPPLNKSGASKMDYNLREHLHSVGWLVKKQKEALGDWDGATSFTQEQKKHLQNKSIAESIFLPLVISDERKAEFIADQPTTSYKLINNNLIVGIAQDKDQTVLVEYLMKYDSTRSLWNVYHKDICVKVNGQYQNYFDSLVMTTGIDISDKHHTQISDSGENYNEFREKYNKFINAIVALEDADIRDVYAPLSNLRKTFNDLEDMAAIVDEFYPINGIQSPYLAYKHEVNYYKNAVSGDYDLFAVWPIIVSNDVLEMTQRISEKKSENLPRYPSQDLFIPVAAKPYALELARSRNVFIEFVETEKEQRKSEDPELGNINYLIQLTAETVNSLVTSAYVSPVPKLFPNRVFHSDEGGRPDVNELEYPIAFFIPKSLFEYLKQFDPVELNVLKGTAFLVESHAEFLSLIRLLRRSAYIFLHHGWVMHWMCLAAGEDKLTETSNRLQNGNEYFSKRISEIRYLDQLPQIVTQLDKVTSLLKELLVNPASAASVPQTPLNEAFNRIIETFLGIAINQIQSPSSQMVELSKAKIVIPD